MPRKFFSEVYESLKWGSLDMVSKYSPGHIIVFELSSLSTSLSQMKLEKKDVRQLDDVLLSLHFYRCFYYFCTPWWKVYSGSIQSGEN